MSIILFLFATFFVEIRNSGVIQARWETQTPCEMRAWDDSQQGLTWTALDICYQKTDGKFTMLEYHGGWLMEKTQCSDDVCSFCSQERNRTIGECYFQGARWRVYEVQETIPYSSDPSKVNEIYYNPNDTSCQVPVVMRISPVDTCDSVLEGRINFHCSSLMTFDTVLYHEDNCNTANVTENSYDTNKCMDSLDIIFDPLTTLVKISCMNGAIPYNICFNKKENDIDVCGAHGICVEENQCECETGWTGTDISDDCSVPMCDGISSQNTTFVCDGVGQCVFPNICNCEDGFQAGSTSDGHCYVKTDRMGVKASVFFSFVTKGDPCDDVKKVKVTYRPTDFCISGERFAIIDNSLYSFTNCNPGCSWCNDFDIYEYNICSLGADSRFSYLYSSFPSFNPTEESIRSELVSGWTTTATYNSSGCDGEVFSYSMESENYMCMTTGVTYECSSLNTISQVIFSENSCFSSAFSSRQMFNISCSLTAPNSKVICDDRSDFNYCGNVRETAALYVCNGHGVCENNACICVSGWVGDNCEFTHCDGIRSDSSSVCNDVGVCLGFNICGCPKGWYNNEGTCIDGDINPNSKGEKTAYYEDSSCLSVLREFVWTQSDSCVLGNLYMPADSSYKTYVTEGSEFVAVWDSPFCNGTLIHNALVGSVASSCFYVPTFELYSLMDYDSEYSEIVDLASGYLLNEIHISNESCNSNLIPAASLVLKTDFCYDKTRYLCVPHAFIPNLYILEGRVFNSRDNCLSQTGGRIQTDYQLNKCIEERLLEEYGEYGYVECLPTDQCNGINSTATNVCSFSGRCLSGKCYCDSWRHRGENCEIDMLIVLALITGGCLLIVVIILFIIVLFIVFVGVKIAFSKKGKSSKGLEKELKEKEGGKVEEELKKEKNLKVNEKLIDLVDVKK